MNQGNTGSAAMLYCTKCGAQTSASATFCQNCGAQLPREAQASAPTTPPYATQAPPPPPPGYYAAPVVAASPYAGFWIRFVAFVIDAVIIGAAMWPFGFIFMGRFMPDMVMGRDPDLPFRMMPMLMAGGFALFCLRTIVFWLYEALMLSSSKQATVGKIAMGIRVTDPNGMQLSFARATGRHFAKYISGFILMIGYIMAAFTDRKRALHDMIADTVVLKSR